MWKLREVTRQGFVGVILVGSNRAQLEKLRLGVSVGEMIAQHQNPSVSIP